MKSRLGKLREDQHHNFLFIVKQNKRPMGHIAHLRKQFKSINTYDYIITLIKRRRKKTLLTLCNSLVLHLKKLESPSPKDVSCQVWLKLAQWFWRRNFLNFVNVFSQFRNYLPLERAGPSIWTNLNPLHPRMLCAKFGWNWPSGSGEEDENVKSLQTNRRTDRQTDDGRQVIRKAHLSFQLRWSKKRI